MTDELAFEDRFQNWTTLFSNGLVPMFPSVTGIPKSDVDSMTSNEQIVALSRQMLDDFNSSKTLKLNSFYEYPPVESAPEYLEIVSSAASRLIDTQGHTHWNIALAFAVARRLYFKLLDNNDADLLAYAEAHMCVGAFWKQPLVPLKGTELLEILKVYTINSPHHVEVWNAIREAQRETFESVFPMNGFTEWEQFRISASERVRVMAMGWLGYVNIHISHPTVVASFYHYWALDREVRELNELSFASYLRSKAFFTRTSRIATGASPRGYIDDI